MSNREDESGWVIGPHPGRESADGALAPPHFLLSSAAAQMVILGPLLIKLSGETDGSQ